MGRYLRWWKACIASYLSFWYDRHNEWYTEIFALFEDKTASRIVYGPVTTELDPDPVKLIPLGISDRQVKLSADNGGWSAYQVLRHWRYIGVRKKYHFTYQFADTIANLQSVGESAGLAFCLKFVQEVYHDKTKKKFAYSIAATGEVSDGTRHARVGRINGIQPKLEVAIEELAAGDCVFYPATNEADMALDIREKATRKGIKLIPVATVEEAIESLLGKRHRSLWPLVLLLLLPFICYFIDCPPYWPWRACSERETPRVLTQAIQALEQGRCVEAKKAVEDFLHRCSPPTDAPLLTLHRQITEPFRIESDILVHRATQPAPAKPGQLVLRSGDSYHLQYTPTDRVYLHIYQHDAGGNLEQLVPNPDHSSYHNPLEAGQRYRLPPDNQWLKLDQTIGQETIYFVASRWPVTDLEALYAQFNKASHAEKVTYRRKFMDQLTMRKHAQAANIGGCFYAEYTFWHAE